MLNKEEIEIQLNAISDIMFLLEENLCEIMKQKIDKVRKYIKQLEKEKEESYWQGYIKKQQESIEICKICKYRDKYRQLEADLYEANNTINQYKEREQKLIKYLEKDITEENIRIINNSRHNEKHVKDLIELEKELIIDVLNQYRRETLERLKGEKNE